MADLVAQSEDEVHRWRRQLHRHTPVTVGRLHASWTVPWDSQVSRRHVTLQWDGQDLTVTRLPEASNPVFFQGNDCDQFIVQPGQYFVIGKTTFTLAQSTVGATMQMPDPAREQLFSKQVLSEIRFRDAEKRLAVLSDLPQLIEGAVDELELFVRLTNVVFGGVSRAVNAAVVQLSDDLESTGDLLKETARETTVQVLHWDRRFESNEAFQPSQRLIQSACQKRQSILHIWEDPKTLQALTMIDPAHDWAFVTPLPQVGNRKMAIYVSGVLSHNRQSVDSISSIATSLKEDIKFTELAANIVGSLLGLRRIQDRQSSFRTIFSPVILEALQNNDPETVLAPKQCEVSVLFCDLRGMPESDDDVAGDLMLLLNRISKALGITTKAILDGRGVVGDFHGDATMGFWGWPFPQTDQATRACRAAIAINNTFQKLSNGDNDPLRDFDLRLGIATGNAVVGQIGTADQLKVSAFGPVVNRAARLEAMNQRLFTSILLDDRTRQKLIEESNEPQDSSSEARLVTRSLGKISPAGQKRPMEVHQLLTSLNDYQGEGHLENFAGAVKAFQSGDWDKAKRLFAGVPSSDRAKSFMVEIMEQHSGRAPSDWAGIVQLPQ